jgi:MFS family permease
MEFTIHHQVLAIVFVTALVMGAVANKTNFCTMGAVSDWVNMGDSGRLRAWLLAMAVAMLGVALMAGMGIASIGNSTFPPYRTPNFAWLRYLLGGLMFGVGMTLASGCGNKTLVRIGGGNMKSLVVLVVASFFAYLMLWGDLYGAAFDSWISATTINLAAAGIPSQELSAVLGLAGEGSAKGHFIVGGIVALVMFGFIFASHEFRSSFDNILAGVVIGLAVVAGWWITGGPWGGPWKEYAEFASEVPSRVNVQSFTFISPMGDTARYLMEPSKLSFINFGVLALTGVILGSLLWSLVSKSFRIEWFANKEDVINHLVGATLMGVGGVLSMGCTVGQAITGFSTLAMGSIITFVSIVAASAATMKYLYWRAMQD